MKAPLTSAVFVCVLATLPALAGGPRKVVDGDPVLWNTDTPVVYFVDRGELGTLSNSAAEAVVREMAAVWAAVPEASISFSQAGQLQVDVTGENVGTDAYPPVGSGVSPILFDDDGSILRTELGEGAEDDILGITRYELDAGTELLEISVVLNGLCYDGVSGGASPCEITFDELRGVVLHELGHFAGLDHTDLNREFFKDHPDFYTGSPPTIDCRSTSDATKSVCTNNAVLPTMFPILSEDDSSLVSLHLDDKLALARLYPETPFPAEGATVQGQVLEGATPFNGANVILRNLADPYRLSASAVSGDVDTDGFFRIEGLPPGNYTLEVRPVASIFTGTSSVGQQNGSVATELGAPAEYLSVTESGDGTTDLPSDIRVLKLVAGDVDTSGIDVVLNDVTTLTDGMSGAGNDTVGTATVVNASGAALPDRIVPGDVDFYQIFLPQGWTLRVDVDAKDGGINPPLTVKLAVALKDTGGGDLCPSCLPSNIPDPATGLTQTDDPAFEYTAPSSDDVIVGIASENDTAFNGGHSDNAPYYLRLTPRAPAVGREMRVVAAGGSSSSAGGSTVAHTSMPTSLGAETDPAPPATVEATPFLPPDRGIDSDTDGLSDPDDPCPGSADTDSDGVCDEHDNCPTVPNPQQQDGGNRPGTVAGDRCDAPLVIAVKPPDQTFEVPGSASVRVEFSEPMDPVTLTTFTVRLEDSGGSVTTDLTLSGDERVVTLAHPSAALAASTEHTVIVEATVQDQDLAAMGTTFNSTFTTRAGPAENIQTDEISSEYEGNSKQGIKSASRFGKSVATHGDVNGDGVRDLLVGAPRADEGATSDVGEVTLWFGDKSAVRQGTGTLLVFQGDVSGERAGASVRFVRDITGDGIDEILIGAPGADPAGGGATGAAYLIFGDPDMHTVSGPVNLSTIDDFSCVRTCGVILAGASVGDLAGQAVSAAGDFDGDDVIDLLVGSPGSDPLARSGAGITYLIYGGAAVQAKGLVNLADVGTSVPGIQFLGEFADDRSGSALSDWADRRFDGKSDILIGSPGVDVRNETDTATFTDAGAVFALMGRDRASYAATVDLADVARNPSTAPGIVFLGIEQDGQAGFSVWGRGDVTGDGEKDILVGAPGMTFQAMDNAGKAFIVPSLADKDDPIKGADSKQTDLSPVKMTPAIGSPVERQLGSTNTGYTEDLSGSSYAGSGADDAAGFAVATAGDLDGDGTEEMLIGAPGADITTVEEALLTSAGRVYVVFGQRSRTPGEVALADVGVTEPGVVIDGNVALGRLGEALTGIGDLDDSGTPELVLGAPGDETTPPNEGIVYVTVPIVATETRDLIMGKSPDPTLEWAPTPGAGEIGGPGRYAVYRGDLSVLALNGEVRTAGKCIVVPLTAEVDDVDSDGSPDFIDNTVPATGAGFWYLVAGASQYGVGPIGDVEGTPRVNDETSCP